MENEYAAFAVGLAKAIQDNKDAYMTLSKIQSGQSSSNELYSARDKIASAIGRLDGMFDFCRTDLVQPDPEPPKKGWIDGVKSIVS